jgi:hypothetical protein
VVGLSIVASAYLAETIRGGIEAVPKGQMEAARSLGMGRGQAMRSIIIPQAFRVMIPRADQRVRAPHQGHVAHLRARCRRAADRDLAFFSARRGAGHLQRHAVHRGGAALPSRSRCR